MRYKVIYFFLTLGILMPVLTMAQIESDTSEAQHSAIKIYNSNFYEFRGDLDPPEEHYKGDVKMTHDSVYMFADTSIISLDYMNAIGNIVIIQDDTIRLFADSLFYDTENGKAELFYNVVLENGKQQLFTERLDYYTETKIAVYPDTALLRNERTKLSSLRGKYDVSAGLATFAGQVIVLDKEFGLTSDSLLYNTDIDKAIFVSPTHIDQETRKIYCESGYYDIKNGQALFEQNANFIDGDQTASADKISYNESTAEITLMGQAKYQDEEKNATADQMVYDENTKDIFLTGNAYFFDGESTATGDEIKYNEDSGEVSILGRAILDSEDTKIVAADLKFDEEKGLGLFEGDVVFLSKEDSVSVFADRMEVDNKEKINIASGENRPYMLRFIDGDSLFLSADTLYVQERKDSIFLIERIDTSFVDIIEEIKITIDDVQKPKDEPSVDSQQSKSKTQANDKSVQQLEVPKDSIALNPMEKLEKPIKPQKDIFSEPDTIPIETIRYDTTKDVMVLDTILKFDKMDTINVFKAYNDVRILSKEFQAVSDSMYYDSKDSLFVLFQNPIMWSDSMQFVGDTIRIRLAKDGVETVFLDGNAMIVELIGAEHYNQLKAKHIEARIDSSSISFMEMRQNAESNYYILDDEDAFVGLNHTLCNRMIFYFEDGEMSDIKFFEQPTSVLTPIQQLSNDQLFLKDFSWNLKLKPNSLEDLLKKEEIAELSAPESEDDDGSKGEGKEDQLQPFGDNQLKENINNKNSSEKKKGN